jgi:hypothetical protein
MIIIIVVGRIVQIKWRLHVCYDPRGKNRLPVPLPHMHTRDFSASIIMINDNNVRGRLAAKLYGHKSRTRRESGKPDVPLLHR